MAEEQTRLRDQDAILQMAMDEIIARMTNMPSPHNLRIGISGNTHTIFVISGLDDDDWVVAFDHSSGKIL